MTASTPDPGWSSDDGPHALLRHAPDPAAALDRLATLHPNFGDHDLTTLVRRVCGDTLSLPPLSDADASGSDDDVTRAVADFAEQFSVDVSAIDDAQRADLAGALGDRVGALVPVLYFADWIPRVRAGLDAVFGSSPSGWPASAGSQDDESKTWPLINKFMVATAQLHALDPLTTEMVRLRQARQHNCRLCKSLRNRTALQSGASEDDFDKLDDYQNSDLSPRHKAALTFADALIWEPAHISQQTASDLRQHFSPAETVELILDLMRNACNKVAVSTGTDGANVSSGVEIYDVSAEGEVEFGLAEPAGYR